MSEYSLSRDARVVALGKLEAMMNGAYWVLMSQGQKPAARKLSEDGRLFSECLASKPSRERLVKDVAAFKQSMDDVLQMIDRESLKAKLGEGIARNVAEISALLDDWSLHGKKKKGPLPAKKGGGDAK